MKIETGRALKLLPRRSAGWPRGVKLGGSARAGATSLSLDQQAVRQLAAGRYSCRAMVYAVTWSRASSTSRMAWTVKLARRTT